MWVERSCGTCEHDMGTAKRTPKTSPRSRETELKFVLDPAQAPAVDDALRRFQSRQASLESHYFDTPHHRLAAAGLSLRLRHRDGVWEQTLKAVTSNAVSRHEDTVPRPDGAGPDLPKVDPRLHARGIAARKLKHILDRCDADEVLLRPVYSTVVVRRSAEIEFARGRVEIALDRGSVHAGSASEPICEVEYELKSGDPVALIEPAKAGVVAFSMYLSTLSKAQRGARLAGVERQPAEVRSRPPAINRSMSSVRVLQRIFSACIAQIVGSAGAIADNGTDERQVHQLRVGLRRLRTASRDLKLLDPPQDRSWEKTLTQAFRSLGDYRDKTTVVASLQRQLAKAGAPPSSIGEPPPGIATPMSLVRDSTFQCALLDLIGFALDESRPQDGGVRPLKTIAARLDKLNHHLKQGARDFERLTSFERHRVRKRLKRLRYLSELVAPLYGKAAVARYLKALEPAQDALGQYVDLIVGERMARARARTGDRESWFAVGWLVAHQSDLSKRCVRMLARAAKTSVFWR